MHSARRAALALAATAALTGTGIVVAEVANAATPEVPAPVATDPTPRPDTPEGYARATVAAWLSGDGATLVDLTTSEVTQFFAAVPAGDVAVAPPPACEGAAGSTVCTWTGAVTTLTVRVRNEAASTSAPDAVADASLTPSEGGVAIWPFTTDEEAQNTQEQVDGGHSPWMVDANAVMSSYATSQLGFADPVVEPAAPTFWQYRITDASTGASVVVDIAQPARTGDGGIWAVTRVAAAAPSGLPQPT